MKIDINEVKRLQDRLREINSLPIDEIEWYDGDVPLDIQAQYIEDWKFVGMSNAAFIDTGFYLEGFFEDEDV